MKQHNIFITDQDMESLRHLLNPIRRVLSKDQEHLEMLEQELDRAQIVSRSRVPDDLVTMNSRVRVKDVETGEDKTYTLVFPRDADFAQGKISVLAPIGTAILGYRVGDVIEWRVPGGRRKLRVQEVMYQPESAGSGSLRNGGRAGESLSPRYARRPTYPQAAYRVV